MSDPPNISLEQSMPAESSQMQALAPTQPSAGQVPAAAVASLPAEAGVVASVRGHAYANGFRQDIRLDGSAVRGVVNGITVIARSAQQTTLDESTPVFKPTETAIRSELARTFPNISMQVVERPMSNAYGPYGLALGRLGGTIHCVYAWQWIEPSELADAGLTGPATVRIRICKGDTTFDALAALLDHLTIRREAGAEIVSETIGEPPAQTKAKAPRRRVAGHRARRTNDQREAAAPPAAIAQAPVVAQALATDLPPQAYLGPRGAKRN